MEWVQNYIISFPAFQTEQKHIKQKVNAGLDSQSGEIIQNSKTAICVGGLWLQPSPGSCFVPQERAQKITTLF